MRSLINFFLLLCMCSGLQAQTPSLPELMKMKLAGRDFSVKELLARNKYYTRYRISYKSGDLTISGIMNLPRGKGPFPVIITNHGYIPTSVYTLGRGLKREQDYLARHGYIVVHPDYRNHALSDKDPDPLARFKLGHDIDVLNCVMAIKRSKKSYFNKTKIGMLGHSRGGGITLNILVTKPDLIQAAVLYAPISMSAVDNYERWMLGKGRPRLRNQRQSRQRRQTVEKIISSYGSPETNPEFWSGLSAQTYLKNIKTPIIIFHGTADKSVPVAWSDRLVKALSQEGKSVIYERFPGGKHEFIKDFPAFMKESVKFFDKYLKTT